MPSAKQAPAAERFDLEHFLPYRLSLLSNTVSQGISAAYRRRFDLSVTEWRVIAILGRFPGLTASEVMGRGAMDKVAVSRAVARLLERGLVERNAQQDDRRRMSLRLTPDHGVPLFAEVVPKALDYEKKLLKSLSAGEREALDGLLGKLQRPAVRLNDPEKQKP
jgi:DNA-binding MarR family transcriptional regulator